MADVARARRGALAVLLAAMLLALLPGSAAAPGLAFGTVVRLGDADAAPGPLLAFASPGLCFLDEDGDGRPTPGEAVVLAKAGCGKGRVHGGDLWLSGLEAGTFVPAGAPTPATPLLPAPSGGALRYADLDADGRWSASDALFLLLDAPHSRVTLGDLRLTASANRSAGSAVLAGEGDVDAALRAGSSVEAFQASAEAFRFWDTDVDRDFSEGDVLYADLDADGNVTVADVRLTQQELWAFGSRPRPGDRDLFPRLSDLPASGRFCFLDLGEPGDSGGEPIYYQPSGCPARSPDTAPRPLLVGDVRMSGEAAGSKVTEGDADIGESTWLLPGTANIGYYDLDRDGRWGRADVLYLHTEAGRRIADVGDLRLTDFGSLAAGSFLRPGHSDLKFLTERGVSVGTFDTWPGRSWRFWDTDHDGALGGQDVLYIDINNDRDVDVGDVRLSPFAGLPFGSVVQVGDADARPALRPLASGAALCGVDADGDGAHDPGGAVVWMPGAACGPVAEGDLRLGGPGAGTRVGAGEALRNRSTVPVPGVNNVRFYDADGSGSWSSPDTLYLHLAAGRAAVTAGDLRLTAYGHVPPGSFVASTDPDPGLATASFPAGANVRALWRFWDTDGDGQPGADEMLYLDVDASGLAGPPDVRLSTYQAGAAVNVSAALQLAELYRTIEALEAESRDQGEASEALQAQLAARNATLRESEANVASLERQNRDLEEQLAKERAGGQQPGTARPASAADLAPMLALTALAALAWRRRR